MHFAFDSELDDFFDNTHVYSIDVAAMIVYALFFCSCADVAPRRRSLCFLFSLACSGKSELFQIYAALHEIASRSLCSLRCEFGSRRPK